jgi:hypothetical protein
LFWLGIATNGKSIAEEAGFLITEISKKTLSEAKIFPFFKLTIFLWKKGKFFADIFPKRSNNSSCDYEITSRTYRY